ncbi:MAG: GNAT family N-acetyltransferase [Clostridiaceae bacterium]|jgi:RimJ/RimL family protein N-acetyltransferase|nr:GNAT family N-acetyltransferase [Clostridiaceae bacterium]
MIHGKNIILRTIYPNEIEHVYELISHINAKGDYWHLSFPSANEFIKEYNRTGFWSTNEGRMLIVSPDGEYIGELIYFKGLDYQSGYEVGYELFSPESSGKGYMSEALLLFCAYMFSVYPINRIQVNTMEGNKASARVAEKCGFTYEGTMRKATFHQGKYHNLRLYSLLREECPPLEKLMA